MIKPSQIVLGAVLVGIAGCSTGRPPSNPAAQANYSDISLVPETLEHVPEEPRIALPSSTLPAPPPTEISPQPPAYSDSWIALNRWSRENGWDFAKRPAQGPEPSFQLTSTNGILSLQASSLVANWSGLELHLGFQPQMIDNQPFVHVLDLRKNVEPLLQGPLPAITNRVIVIDPGHGGSNTGTVSVDDGHYEKEFTLDWARRLKPLLESEGWQVFLTRTNDVDVSLAERVAFAEQHRAGLFLSLHFNSAAPNQEQTGLETYCLTPPGMPSTLTRGYDDNTTMVYTNNAFDAENLQCAVLLQRALLTVVGTDRGVRRARFLGVLRGQNRPAVLVEGGFLSNPAEARRIADPAYRQRLAEAIASALNQKSGIDNLAVAGKAGMALNSALSTTNATSVR